MATLRLHPEVILIGDNTLSRLRWTIDQETARLDSELAEHPEVIEEMQKNGWTMRMLAWGHVLYGFLEQLEFDDEKGRC